MRHESVAASVSLRGEFDFRVQATCAGEERRRGQPASSRMQLRVRSERRRANRRRFGFADFYVNFPKLFPVIFGEWMQVRIAGHDRSGIRPLRSFFDEVRAYGIFQNVKANFRERAALPVFLFEHVVTCLPLQLVRVQEPIELSAQKHHPVELIAFAAQSHPDEMDVIRHQTKDRAKQIFVRAGVEQEFAEAKMKIFIEPALHAIRDGLRPVNDGMALVMMPSETWEVLLLSFRHGVGLTRIQKCGQAFSVAASVSLRADPRNEQQRNTRSSQRDLPASSRMQLRSLRDQTASSRLQLLLE